ncbi:MAG TPA: ABC transporter substrate-binding protein [Thermoleophilia bacterium]|nr:ABC transporter substrate-binding protein [Thermoleophilia bacterium]HQG03329.1 ABC transporter substrate-binding protein [Thermoleophilia bacterium]HQH22380.1 ABC transporter substrate-binding protein [Thermoleophilia bacterium]HQJ98234.1 ABC transporter substrate-binding protein [Thermoleophilia bacterium]
MTIPKLRSGRFAAVVLTVCLVCALAAVMLAGCGSDGGTEASSSSTVAGPITVTDDAGQQVSLEQPAERIVSLAPANTEIAYAIGAGDKMVAGTSYDDYPEDAKALPKIGDFANPSVEKIASFDPDLVLAAGGVQDGLRTKLEDLGIKVYVIDPTTYGGVMTTISRVGKLAGTSAEAEKVVQEMAKARDDVQARVGSLAKVDTFLEIYSEPLMTAGSGTFIDDMINLAGGTNIGATAGDGYPNFSAEVLLEKDPAVYIADSGSMSEPGAIAERDGYAGLTAVKEGRVYVINDNLIARCGPRLAKGLARLARMIHPEAYAAQ